MRAVRTQNMQQSDRMFGARDKWPRHRNSLCLWHHRGGYRNDHALDLNLVHDDTQRFMESYDDDSEPREERMAAAEPGTQGVHVCEKRRTAHSFVHTHEL